VHLILTPDAGVAQIPELLAGNSAKSDSELGTHNYSKVPIAVLLGAGYDDEGVAKMMEATADKSAKGVPWLRPDTSKPAPPLGPEYGKALVQRIKELLAELQQKGGMDEAKVHWY